MCGGHWAAQIKLLSRSPHRVRFRFMFRSHFFFFLCHLFISSTTECVYARREEHPPYNIYRLPILEPMYPYLYVYARGGGGACIFYRIYRNRSSQGNNYYRLTIKHYAVRVVRPKFPTTCTYGAMCVSILTNTENNDYSFYAVLLMQCRGRLSPL